MANVIIVVGQSGTGKSTSVKTLDPKETYIINTLNKPLPFKGSAKIYNPDNKNIGATYNPDVILTTLRKINSDFPHIKNVVLDDIGFVMSEEFFARAKETGYSKFTELAQKMQNIIKTCRDLRADLNIVFMFHEDIETSNNVQTRKKVKTVGKLLDDQYNPLASVSVALFTEIVFDKDGKATYNFVTNTTMDNFGRITPAKSPEGMFDEVYIPNDLNFVIQKVNEFYN